MANSYISKITLPSGNTYDIKDSEARSLIDTLQKYTDYLGVTTTELTDGAEIATVSINGEDKAAKIGNIVNYGKKEFIYNGSAWQEFGDLSALGALAYKSSASGSYTPAGTINELSFTGTAAEVSIDTTAKGTVAVDAITPAGTVSAPAFTGAEGDVTVTGDVTGASAAITVGTGTANYTPAGSVSAPTIKVTPTTTAITGIDSVGTQASCTMPTLSTTVGDDETLILSWTDGSFTANELPTKAAAVDAVTAVAASADAPTFTGTGVDLETSVSGGSITATGKFTPAGTVAAPTFTGTAVTPNATFTGTKSTGTASITPEGTITKPVFTGTQGTVTVE